MDPLELTFSSQVLWCDPITPRIRETESGGLLKLAIQLVQLNLGLASFRLSKGPCLNKSEEESD